MSAHNVFADSTNDSPVFLDDVVLSSKELAKVLEPLTLPIDNTDKDTSVNTDAGSETHSGSGFTLEDLVLLSIRKGLPQITDKIVSADMAANYLQVPETSISRLVEKFDAPGIKVGDDYVFIMDELEEYKVRYEENRMKARERYLALSKELGFFEFE